MYKTSRTCRNHEVLFPNTQPNFNPLSGESINVSSVVGFDGGTATFHHGCCSPMYSSRSWLPGTAGTFSSCPIK
jgi:hypothetical protein